MNIGEIIEASHLVDSNTLTYKFEDNDCYVTWQKGRSAIRNNPPLLVSFGISSLEMRVWKFMKQIDSRYTHLTCKESIYQTEANLIGINFVDHEVFPKGPLRDVLKNNLTGSFLTKLSDLNVEVLSNIHNSREVRKVITIFNGSVLYLYIRYIGEILLRRKPCVDDALQKHFYNTVYGLYKLDTEKFYHMFLDFLESQPTANPATNS